MTRAVGRPCVSQAARARRAASADWAAVLAADWAADLAAGCVVAWLGVAYTAEKSASSMADAATKFLSSLTPEQRQKAAFAFEGDERLTWHFIPTEMFPRNGLTVGDMSEA